MTLFALRQVMTIGGNSPIFVIISIFCDSYWMFTLLCAMAALHIVIVCICIEHAILSLLIFVI